MTQKTVTVTPLQSFQHGQRAVRKGVAIDLPEALAEDLRKAKLVKLGSAQQPDGKESLPVENKKAPARQTKAAATDSEAA